MRRVHNEDVSYFLINSEIMFEPDNQQIVSISNNQRISLTTNVSRMLLLLCTKSETIIDYKEIMSYIWGEKSLQIGYGSLYQTILILRKSLKTLKPDIQCIKTVRKQGVCFTAEVEKILMLRQESSVYQESFYKKCKKIYTSKKSVYIVVVVIMLFFLVVNFIEYKSKGVFDDYIFDDNLPGGCSVYFNSGTQYKDFLNKNPALCVPHVSLYVTSFKTTSDVSIVQCKKNHLNHKEENNCSVTFYSKSIN